MGKNNCRLSEKVVDAGQETMLPQERTPMRKIKEVLRLHFEARLSERQIAQICALGKGTVRRFLQRVEAAEISWPLPPELDEAALVLALRTTKSYWRPEGHFLH